MIILDHKTDASNHIKSNNDTIHSPTIPKPPPHGFQPFESQHPKPLNFNKRKKKKTKA